jgi:hypothetical protein
MPCYDPQAAEDDRKCAERLNRATRLLCEIMTTLDRELPVVARTLQYDSADLKAWWAEHKKDDAARQGTI